jgi:hypothetical protein
MGFIRKHPIISICVVSICVVCFVIAVNSQNVDPVKHVSSLVGPVKHVSSLDEDYEVMNLKAMSDCVRHLDQDQCNNTDWVALSEYRHKLVSVDWDQFGHQIWLGPDDPGYQEAVQLFHDRGLPAAEQAKLIGSRALDDCRKTPTYAAHMCDDPTILSTFYRDLDGKVIPKDLALILAREQSDMATSPEPTQVAPVLPVEVVPTPQEIVKDQTDARLKCDTLVQNSK